MKIHENNAQAALHVMVFRVSFICIFRANSCFSHIKLIDAIGRWKTKQIRVIVNFDLGYNNISRTFLLDR